MAYYFSAIVDLPFEKAVERTREALAAQGFGVLTDVDVKATLDQKLGTDFRPYRILGACNPEHAHAALLAEDKVGLMLPCGVVVQQLEDGRVEVAAIDPVAAMGGIDNPRLAAIAGPVRDKLKAAIDSL